MTRNDWAAVSFYAELVGTDVGYLISEAETHSVPPAVLVARFEQALTTDDSGRGFEDFATLPPGSLDLRVFDQGTWWVDVFRQPHRITVPDDLRDDHLMNVLAFLLDGAERFHAGYFTAAGRPSPWSNAETWLHQTALMLALRRECTSRLLDI